ncbi:MAG: hypothetical protein PHO02_04905 [Candidatus Nanoarchaeia archaeon]|nr:hypothetical protein [Candidatus Nanoarchaeia archaeon]
MAIKSSRIHVPLEIRVSGYNGEPFYQDGPFSAAKASAGIMNEQGQMLVKLGGSESYTVFSGFPNDNKGDNYLLVQRKAPRKGKLYFATDYEGDSSKFQENLKSIENYVILINKDTYVFWKPVLFPSEKTVFEVHHLRTWVFNSWKHFYEVKKLKDKK